jgi:hypothetical protein
MLKPKSGERCGYTPTNLSASHKADRNSFLRQERSADGRIHTITSHVQWETLKKNCVWTFKTEGVKCCSFMAIRILIQQHLSWELFDHPPIDCHLLTCPKNLLRSQRFNYNEQLMEGVKTWLGSQAAVILGTRGKIYCPI